MALVIRDVQVGHQRMRLERIFLPGYSTNDHLAPECMFESGYAAIASPRQSARDGNSIGM